MAQRRPWHTEEYRQHLRSDGWRARRSAYFKAHGYRCEACGIRKKITVHHLHYDTLGHESDKDIVTLCWRCHRNCHEADNSGRFASLIEATLFIVDRGKRRQHRRRRCSRLPLVGWLFR